MLGCIQPMSSPMMKRMLGFFSAGVGVVIFSCATAGAAVTTAAKPTARSAAKAIGALVRLRLPPEEIWIVLMGTSCDGCPRQRSFGLRPVAIKRLRQRQKVRGRGIANTEEALEEAPTGALAGGHGFHSSGAKNSALQVSQVGTSSARLLGSVRCDRHDEPPSLPICEHVTRAQRLTLGVRHRFAAD